MRLSLLLVCVFAALSDLSAQIDTVIRSAAKLKDCIYRTPAVGAPFELVATVVEKNTFNITFADKSGACYASFYEPAVSDAKTTNGDLVRISGLITRDKRFHTISAVCTELKVLRHGEPLKPQDATVSGINSGEHDFQLIRFRGTLRNFSRDETDAQYTFFLVEDKGDVVTVPVMSPLMSTNDRALKIGSTVEVVGICHYGFNCPRVLPGHFIASARIRLVAPPPDDPFDVPALDDVRRMSAAEIARLGRRRISGQVLVTYGTDRAIVRSPDGQVHCLKISTGGLPPYGACITAVGYPETDSFRNNLACATWRPDPVARPIETNADPLDIGDLFRIVGKQPEYKPDIYGALVRFSGKYKNATFDKLYVQHPLALISVDTSSCPNVRDKLEPESTLEITGVYILDIETGQPNEIFPRTRGFSIVLRDANDIQVTATPPWWNTKRLLAAIGILLAALFAILFWNILLRRVSERRGRELAKEQIARSQADLRTRERTRLAVELHDSLAQNLIGAAMEIKAARRFADIDSEAMKRHLGIAEKTIDSCRGEARNCIRDLRSTALEESDLNLAIRQTLEPHLGSAKLTMRFNIPRKALSINALHAFICIIRELTINAVRHGHAKSIWVAGSIEGDRLMFSVRDDGCGFDPCRCPGMEKGHFGLQGIRERVKRFGGSFEFERLSSGGMKATITIGQTEIT